MKSKHPFVFILIVFTIILQIKNTQCLFPGLSDWAGKTLGHIDRAVAGVSDNIERHRQRFRHRHRHREEEREREREREREKERERERQREPEREYEEEDIKSPKEIVYIGFKGKEDIKGKPCQTTDGLVGLCESPSFCFSQYNELKDYVANRCPLSNGAQGICCSKETRKPTLNDLPIRIPHPYSPSARNVVKRISLEDIDRAAEESHDFVEHYIHMEKKLIKKGIVQRRGSTQSQHQAFFGPFDENQFTLTKGGYINLLTTIKIKEKFKLTNEEARDGLWKYTLENTNLEKYCIKEPECRSSKYRTADGSCNNLQRPLWGRSNTGFMRLVPPAYADGLSAPRLSVTGAELPNARVVSLSAATESKINDKKFTLFVMQWGQLIDHDLTLSASSRAATGEGLICCYDANSAGVRNFKHPSCYPIAIPRNDPFYSKHRQTCMNFVRNAPVPRANCALGHREQMNTLTHIIDGSMVYGSDAERTKHLREFRGGRLRTSTVNNVRFLPFDSQNRSDECAVPERNRHRVQCFVGGDVRVNEQTGLAMAHNLLLREHNRVADILLKLNPKWNDEITFQEARRIVAAEVQHITYNEWIPLIIGRSVMKAFNILPKAHGFTYDYDPKVNPNIINAFATAAYRFHTLIQGFIELMDNKGRVTEVLQLRNLFNNPQTLYRKGAFDEYLNGYTAEPTQTFDKFFTKELTEHLFEEHNTGFGMDLIALNIQRGREHGLPGYNEYRKVCGMDAIKSFAELDQVMQSGSAQTFDKLYESVDDIDLFIAGNHEKRLPDAVVGPTFACILAEQHRRGKLGDRFWYENGDMPHSFTEEQLRQIRKSSLAQLVCDNSDGIETMQSLAFIQPLNWNKRIACKHIARPNLDHWRGEKDFGGSARLTLDTD